MSDKKANLPDLNEITSMASKLFKDVKTSVTEIIGSYKQKREQVEPKKKAAPAEKVDKKESE